MIIYLPARAVYWHTSVAFAVSISPPVCLAVRVTGFGNAVVQVAFSCPDSEVERRTEGSLALQMVFARVPVTAGHPGTLLTTSVAAKV
jgi:hypothetical protein